MQHRTDVIDVARQTLSDRGERYRRAKGDTPAADHWRKLITMAAGSPAQRSADAHSSSDLNDRQLLRGGQKLVTEHVPYIEFQLDAIKSQTMSGISHPA